MPLRSGAKKAANLRGTIKLHYEMHNQVNAILVRIEEDGFTCIKSGWWDKLFLVRVHAREKSCLVHNVKAGVHLLNKQGHEIKDS